LSKWFFETRGRYKITGSWVFVFCLPQAPPQADAGHVGHAELREVSAARARGPEVGNRQPVARTLHPHCLFDHFLPTCPSLYCCESPRLKRPSRICRPRMEGMSAVCSYTQSASRDGKPNGHYSCLQSERGRDLACGGPSSKAGGGVRPGLQHAAGLFRHDSGHISRRVPFCLYCARGIWDDDPHPFEFCTRSSRRPCFTRDKGPVVYGLCLQRRNHICRRATTACKPLLGLPFVPAVEGGVLSAGAERPESRAFGRADSFDNPEILAHSGLGGNFAN